jgi:hypothetical protein
MKCERAVILPPTLIDQSFPRNIGELNTIAACIGELEGLIESVDLHIVATEVFVEFLSSFEWQRENTNEYPLLNDIYGFLMRLFGDGSGIGIRISVAEVNDSLRHPLPNGCSSDGLAEIWQDEVGRLLALHDRHANDNRFFLGVACANSFAEGRFVGTCYQVFNCRAFPLVGPDTVFSLDEILTWDVRESEIRGQISVDMARRNIPLIGGKIVDPPESSHQKIRFDGARPWVLGRNDDPVPEDYLRQLIEKAKLPYEVIRYALINGELPKKRIRIPLV